MLTGTFCYIALFRPLHNKVYEFIMINSFWEVDSMTLNMANLFGLDPDSYKLVFG